MKKYIFGVLIILLVNCLAIRLEKKLPKDMREWYDNHYTIMGNKLPAKYSEDRKERTESMYWLLLSDDLKRKYIKVFWSLRWTECEAEFKARVDWASKFYQEIGIPGEKTDRGYIFIICGFPADELKYPDTRQPSGMSRDDEDIDGMSYMVWSYPNRGRIIRVWFRYRAGQWRQEPVSAAGANEVYQLIQDSLTWWFPWDWEIWEKARE